MKKFFYAHLLKIFIMVFVAFACITTATDISSDASAILLRGVASWYSESSPGIKPTTANMEIFSEEAMTCASWDFPFDTILEVKNLDTGKKIHVRVNDRGPAKRLYEEGRVIDLTKAAFNRISDPENGLTPVSVRVKE